jgi:hypothetical protein
MKLALFAFAAFVIIAAIWIARDRESQRGTYPEGSSFNAGSDGILLAREYLARSGVHAEALTLPLAEAQLPADAIVLRMSPDDDRDRLATPVDAESDAGVLRRPAGAGLTDAEETFVRGGGRLVLARPGVESKAPEEKVSPLLPGIAHLDPLKARSLRPAWLVDASPVFERGEAPSMARRALGKGEVWLVAEPDIFSNDRLSEADHLALLVALTSGGRPVYFDEAVHGFVREAGTLQLLGRFGLGPAVALIGLALCALFWRRAIVLGPPADPLRDQRSEAVEMVDSLASLYQGGLTRAEALRLYRTRIVREIALRLALDEKRAAAVFDRLAPQVAEVPRLSKSEFTRQLHGLVSACKRFRDEHGNSRR